MNDKCETCGRALAPGHLPGNHVRGENDKECDGCVNNNRIKDGVFQFRPGEFTAYYNGKRIADFNSYGAAQAGIEVEKRRQKNKLK